MSTIRDALLSATLLLAGPALAKDDGPPSDSAELQRWWTSAGQMWMGETGYVIGKEGLQFTDGVCSFQLTEGALVPIYSGKPPVSERMVGMIFLGKGDVTMAFPSRADAWTFANHMVETADARPEAFRAILQDGAPFTTGVNRGMILTADPEVLKLIYNLEPMGAGAMITAGENGVDEVYVVTDHRGRLKSKIIGANVLANRTAQLEGSGLDPKAIIRQDRLLHEELGFPGEMLRTIADFRTDTPFRVAAGEGRVVGTNEYDNWLTCYRDGQDLTDTGYRSMAFAHGKDNEEQRHFMRFSGELFHPIGSPEPLRPPVRMDPVFADTHIEVRPFRRSLEMQGQVESLLTLQAEGADLQHVIMRLPYGSAIKGTWKLEALELEDGTPLPWVGVTANLPGTTAVFTPPGEGGAETSVADEGSDEGDLGEDQSSGDASEGDIGTQADSSAAEAETLDSPGDFSIGEGSEDAALAAREIFVQRRTRYEILAILPQPVPQGQQVKIRLKWSANWKFANFDNTGRYLGPTTGDQPLLPEILPAPGGNTWSFRTTLGNPSPALRSLAAVTSGDTEKTWVDDGNSWQWVVASGENLRSPSLALGRWYAYEEPAASGMPAVRVNLFPAQGDALTMFPPEIRRVVAFMERFHPAFPMKELEVYQGPSAFAYDALTEGFSGGASGLIGIETVSSTTVTSGAAVRDENPYLIQDQIARQVAAQYWGQAITPASSRDQWLMDALPGTFAAFYIRGAFGIEAYEKHIAAIRERLENPTERSRGQGEESSWKAEEARRRSLSLTGSPTLTDVPSLTRSDYGVYVLSELLRSRVGDQVFFSSLDALAKERDGRRVTTEQFQTILEEKSGQDLSDFFDYWIHAGHIPSLSATVKRDGDVIRGCVQTDLPYGSFDVMMVLTDENDAALAGGWVQLVGGQGYFEAPLPHPQAKIKLDPQGLVLAHARTVTEADALPCSAPISAGDPAPSGEMNQ